MDICNTRQRMALVFSAICDKPLGYDDITNFVIKKRLNGQPNRVKIELLSDPAFFSDEKKRIKPSISHYIKWGYMKLEKKGGFTTIRILKSNKAQDKLKNLRKEYPRCFD